MTDIEKLRKEIYKIMDNHQKYNFIYFRINKMTDNQSRRGVHNMNTDVLGEIASMLNITSDKKAYYSWINQKQYNLTDGESKKIYDFWLSKSKVESKVDADGTKAWYVNGKLHREGGLPAAEWGADGTKFWYVNGERHRDGGLPAVEANGLKSWYVNGKLHRDGGLPAVEWADGTKEWYVNGTLQRTSS